jgi:hypothetical protein
MPLQIFPIKPDAKGHRTRSSDSSFYDEVCVTCGATDAGSALNGTCPNQVTDEVHAAERLATAQYQLISGGSTTVKMLRLLVETTPSPLSEFYIKEVNRVCDLVEVLLEERKKPSYEHGYKDGEGSMHADYVTAFEGIVDSFTGPQDLAKQIEEKLTKLTVPLSVDVNVDVGDALLKGKTPEEQEEMRQGFAQWFEINRAKSKELKGPPTAVVFFIDGEEVYRVSDASNYGSETIEFVARRNGLLTWGYELHGVIVKSDEVDRTYGAKHVMSGDPVSLDGFKSDLARLSKSLKPIGFSDGGIVGTEGTGLLIDEATPPLPGETVLDIDATLSQFNLDQADAIDFGTSYKAVKMAREAYEGEQKKTRLFFMADWNKLARFKRRELARAKM